MKIKKQFRVLLRTKLRKTIAIYLAMNIIAEICIPTCAFALTGGPSQPEVQSFTAIDTSDMVDPFSGDFKYNIPLMDIDGYPINIAYNSGITMDQEASWVGLGWNINAGVVNRSMRGLPDDFSGDEVVKESNMKPNRTYGINVGAGVELFGKENVAVGLQASFGIKFNNYHGYGVERSLSVSLSGGEKCAGPLNGSLGLNSSSDEGLSVSPSIGLTARMSNAESSGSLGINLGCSFNSRQGLKAFTISGSASMSAKGEKSAKSSKPNTSASIFSQGASASFDQMMPTYTPYSAMSMRNTSINASFKLGGEIYGVDANASLSGYYSEQKLSQQMVKSRAYGYMNADEGAKSDLSLMDFNREKDGAFTPTTPGLPLSNFTYDIFSVSGQGAGGSYRPFRSDMGNVFDPTTISTSEGNTVGSDVGIGNLFHGGIDLSTNSVETRSGRWNYENRAIQKVSYKPNSSDPLYEPVYFKESNEKSVDSDPSFLAKQGGFAPQRFNLNQLSSFYTVADDNYSSGLVAAPDAYRKSRDKRNQSVSMLTRKELDVYGLDEPTTQSLTASASTQGHHIAEITSLGTDGKRYVYGKAAYNLKQEETTFAIGAGAGISGLSPDYVTGLVTYQDWYGDNSINNKYGLDNFYSNTILPGYAHSYLLSAVLSPDYVDNDGIRGTSDDDLGSYTKFDYLKIPTYKWRIPTDLNKATYNEGLKSDASDDKASYIYGEKELWFLKTIETKNYIAIFTLEARDDARGVINKNGGTDLVNANASQLLRKISLYTKSNYLRNKNNPSAYPLIPIKEVNFEYDYSLCPGVTNNINNGGKLTLKRIYFTYQNSKKGRLSPYTFTYSTTNPRYNIKGYDRWGNYKPYSGANWLHSSPLTGAEYPYVDQTNRSSQDANATAWTMTSISLPSGGKININYESDDYAYVQNKQAMQMHLVTGSAGTLDNNQFTFPLQRKKDGSFEGTPSAYLNNGDLVYYRFLVKIGLGTTQYDYISGYAPATIVSTNTLTGIGTMSFTPVSLKDNGSGPSVCPITKAAIQFVRTYNPTAISAVEPPSGSNAETFNANIFKAMAASSFIKNIADAIQGPNLTLYNKDIGKFFVPNKSWVRLKNATGSKLGGGLRVKDVRMSDEWKTMTGQDNEASFDYGQEYSYTLLDGKTSSGVASYEPQIGGDENPWKMPIFFDEKRKMAPDDQNYMEEPFGESFFPSPSVGYSRVTIKNLKRTDVNSNATGSVVHEFYTSKDFPTITSRTDLHPVREKTDPFSLSSLFQIDVKDYMTTSQGYVIELNDMNGKPKSQKVYAEDQLVPISSVEYKYKSDSYLSESKRLNNQVTIVNSDGSVNNNASIGVFYDYTSDFRESENITQSSTAMINVDVFLVLAAPVAVPMIWPSSQNQTTRFRSAVVTKVIQRFGILEETIAKDLGSVVSTKNVAYDSETGDVLLTQTTTDFNDPIYSFKYPAYWYYDGMGPAYKNIGFAVKSMQFTNGEALLTSANLYFAEGDELRLAGSGGGKAWVTKVTNQSITAVDRGGNIISGTFNVKILRSGRKNQQMETMETLVSLSNPIASLQSNAFDRVVQASAIEFVNENKIHCDCVFDDPLKKTTNPYVLGTKGVWRPKKSYLHLTGRTQSNFDNNTNIRKDGIFTSYSPFYKMVDGMWTIDYNNWTYTSEVTEYSPFGMELENKDALNRFSTATYGYNQTLATSVAANARYRDVGADNFEDFDFSVCADNHFKLVPVTIPYALSSSIDETQSHTGRRSLKVTQTTPITLSRKITLECEQPPACAFNLTYGEFFTSSNSLKLASAFTLNKLYAVENEIASLTCTWGSQGTGTVTGEGTRELTFTDLPVGAIRTVDITAKNSSGVTIGTIRVLIANEGIGNVYTSTCVTGVVPVVNEAFTYINLSLPKHFESCLE